MIYSKTDIEYFALYIFTVHKDTKSFGFYFQFIIRKVKFVLYLITVVSATEEQEKIFFDAIKEKAEEVKEKAPCYSGLSNIIGVS